MGQTMATMFWRLLGREAGKSFPVSCDHHNQEEEEELSFFGRVCQLCRAIIRRLLGGGRGSRKPPSDPVSSYHLNAHHCIVNIEPILGTAIRAVDVEIGKGPGRPRPPIRAVDVEIGKGPEPPIRAVDVEIGKGPGRPRPPVRAVDVEIGKGPGRPRPPISSSSVGKRGKLGPYRWDQKILLVGDGDFSFSASLAVAFGDASHITATSLDSFGNKTE